MDEVRESSYRGPPCFEWPTRQTSIQPTSKEGERNEIHPMFAICDICMGDPMSLNPFAPFRQVRRPGERQDPDLCAGDTGMIFHVPT